MSVLTAGRIPGNDVVCGTKPLPVMPYEQALKLALNSSSLEAFSRDTKELVSPDQSSYDHAFIAAVNAAYAGHYPLVLSPDMIWLLIAQGFACHVNQNAEALRHQFVAHSGKAKLVVERDDFMLGFAGNDWEGVFTEFSGMIRDHIGEKAHQVIVPTFSTTGIVEKAAFEITLMDAMQSYFEYSVGIICGIPWFALEGTSEDWKLVRDSAAALGQYDLDWWMPYLLPILDEFVAASEGRPNRTFWENFCRLVSGGYCGEAITITGFVNNLFAYINKNDIPEARISAEEEEAGREAIQKEISLIYDPDEYMARKDYLMRKLHRLATTLTMRNPCLKTLSTPPTEAGGYGLRSDEFPSAMSIAPFTLEVQSLARRYPMEFIAGFVGFAQDRETLAIRPEISWAVRYAETSPLSPFS